MGLTTRMLTPGEDLQMLERREPTRGQTRRQPADPYSQHSMQELKQNNIIDDTHKNMPNGLTSFMITKKFKQTLHGSMHKTLKSPKLYSRISYSTHLLPNRVKRMSMREKNQISTATEKHHSN